MAGMYAVWHGPQGITRIARRVAAQAGRLRRVLGGMGLKVLNPQGFDTLHVDCGANAGAVMAAALQAGINLRRVDERSLAVSLDETVTEDDLALLAEVFSKGAAAGSSRPEASASEPSAGDAADIAIPAALLRKDGILSQPVFSRIKSETDMLRYLRGLADKDLALDRGMIPLGSCTMKLNAAAEMMPITWPGFCDMHPYAPQDQAAGYQELDERLSAALCEITGYDAVSLQPNSGAQGEYAGLLAIRAYHRERGQPQRDICLIPASAHGTNPASARMAGMQVLVVESDANGQVDLADLDRKIAQAADRLAALMISYPSTHGVFEPAITAVCDKGAAAGGQGSLGGADMGGLRAGAHGGARPRGGGGRAGLPGRRHWARDGGPGQAGPVRLRCLPPESSRDLRHSPRRGRRGCGTGGGAGPPRPLFAGTDRCA